MAAGAGLGATAFAGGALARQAANPHAVEDFFARPLVRGAALSPSGDRIAIIRDIWEGGQRRAVLDTADAADPSKPPVRSPIGDVDCESMEWVSDSRLLVWVALKTRTDIDRRSARSLIGTGGDEIVSRRVLSIDPTTGGAVVLFSGDNRRMRAVRNLGVMVDPLHADPDHVLMAAPSSIGVLTLFRVNVLTGRAEEVEQGGNGTFMWQAQGGVPVLRYDVNVAGNAFSIHARAPGETRWTFVRRVRLHDAPDFEWVAETGTPGIVLVAAREEGEDVISIREMDLKALTFGPPIATREKADVIGGLTDDVGRYLGAAYIGDRLEYDFARPELAAHHRAMNRFFDNECNVALIDIDRSLNRFLAYVTGPREPGAWYLYDRGARSFVNLVTRTSLAADRLGTAEVLDVATRDGATIRAYLTAPAGRAPGPLVVMPHGGPEVRDSLGWDRQVQLLAAQGWWVLQPNFRGSGGYGLASAGEGWGRWGDRMQEDIEDAVAQVVRDKGLAADKVGIMGSSYGGYAALMGVVRRPDLYKAAVAICGVFDLPEMLAYELRDDNTPDNEVYQFWVKRIGDPRADRAALEAASPRRRAADIRCPVLLVHGVDDPIVPVFQSRRMKDALTAAGRVSVDYVEVRNAGHGDWEDEIEQELFGKYIALFRQAFA